MEKLQHIVTDLHRVYLTEMEAKIQPKIANKKEQPTNAGGDGGDAIKKAARQLAYDTRYKARREDLPLERAFNQVLQNSSASSPVKDAAKAMLFGGGDTKKEEYEIDEASKQKVLVKPAKGFGKSYRRYADSKKIHQLRKNPQISSVTPTSYGTPYEGERKKGEQTAAALQAPKGNPKKKDYDGDGKVESGSKEHAGAVHNAIQRKKGGVPDGKDTRKKKNEDYSDWRSELNLFEAETENKKKLSGNNVNNSKYITINPELKEAVDNLGGVLVEDINLTEDYIIESVNYAADYFYNEGLNEEGVEYVIEEIGIDRFFDFVMELSSYYNSQLNEDIELDEARAAKKRKGGKSYEQVKAEIDAKEKAKSAKKAPSVPTASAKQKQPNKKPVRDAIARGVFRAVDAYKKGMDRHNAAMKTAKKAATVGGKAASEFGKGFASGVKTAGKVAKGVKKVVNNEASDPLVSAKQKDTERKQVENARQKIRSMVGESKSLNELNRAEKETGINTKTGKPTQKGGAKDDKAFTSVKRMIRGMEGTPAGQRKKVPGKKPPTAGQWGAPRSPAQKVAARRAAAKRFGQNMSSRFD
jgi:hypothetical protein